MADWQNALRQRQGNVQTGAGQPGMGGGNIPYAPGSTQYSPSQEPPRHQSQPQTTGMPQGAGNGAAMAPDTSAPAAPAGGPPGASGGQMPMMDPSIALRYASYLMQRYMRAREQGTGYRG